MSSDNPYAIRAPNSTNVVIVNQNGDTIIGGNLDVGSGSSSKINVHAANNGYTGHAELNAASSFDMYLDLETTRVNGGCVYFTINGDSYMQLPGTDNKVNIYNDTTIS